MASTWDTCLSLTVVSQSEARINTEHGIRNRYVPLLNHNNAWQSANRVHNSWKWICVNSLWTSDAKWRHGFRWTLVQVAICCVAAPSHYQSWCWIIIRNKITHWDRGANRPNHYLNKCWLIVNWAIENKFERNFNQSTALLLQENEFE